MSRLALVLLAEAVLGAWVMVYLLALDDGDLRARVACLEHPGGASSVAGRFVNARAGRAFVVTQPVHRTGCK